MVQHTAFIPSNDYWPETHQVENRPKALVNFNRFNADLALIDSIQAHQAEWAMAQLSEFGQLTGSAKIIELGFAANENKPQLYTHDRHGERIDEVRFHPAYHQLMQLSLEQGIHSSHWQQPKVGAHVARAAKSYLITQVEAGHGCPITMTSASIAALKHQPDIYGQWAPKIMACGYDYRNVPAAQKAALTIGMAMTEKQGGSDVRTNTTRAIAMDQGGPGQPYQLVGHKYFVSAPMCDAFLVLAQTDAGICCFLVPRWRPDGSKNPLQIQQLKNKMGNVSNASCETELRGALGWMIGQPGRGVAVILDMVAMTRFDCMIGSTAGMRQAVIEAINHCSQRVAFGKSLSEHPLMQNVLADLVIENEAALALSMRMASALDSPSDEAQKQLLRVGTAVGKYWICKRTPGHAYEAMECIGGSGVMEDTIMPRLLRESPVNSIWEGSGNVQCLDMLRAINKTPQTLEALMSELNRAKGADRHLDKAITQLGNGFVDSKAMEYQARSIVERMALALSGASLVLYGNSKVAEAFCASRLAADNQGWVYGTLPVGIDCKGLIERARVGG